MYFRQYNSNLFYFKFSKFFLKGVDPIFFNLFNFAQKYFNEKEKSVFVWRKLVFFRYYKTQRLDFNRSMLLHLSFLNKKPHGKWHKLKGRRRI